MSYEEFRKRIDTARQILVGAVPSPAGQIDQITYALMYKFMNDRDDRALRMGGERAYFTGDYEKYNWHKLMDPTLDNHDRLELYRQAIQNMAKNENLPELFRSIYLNAFLPFNSSTVLAMFLKEINKFEHTDSDDIGDAYEYLLSITGAQGDVGQFRTPRHIIKFIVEAVNPTKDDKVLDPAVGTAGFLIAAYKHVMSQHDGKDEAGKNNDEVHLSADEMRKIHKNYRGFDIDPTMVRTAKVNLYLHGFPSPDVLNHDSLSSEDYWDGPDNKYDVILANPPFMTPKGGIQPHKKFSINANRAEVLFVDYIASHLKPDGRAGIVVPESVIFQSGKAYKELRKKLTEEGLVAVISFPSGIFLPYADARTSVLIIDKELARRTDDILFMSPRHFGHSLTTRQRKIEQNDLPDCVDTYRKFYDGKKIASTLLHFTHKKSDILSEKDIDLSQEQYRELVFPPGAKVLQPRDNFVESKVKVVKGEYRVWSVSNKQGFVLSDDYFGNTVASTDISSYKVVRPGYFAYNPARINVGSIAYNDTQETGAVSPMYVVFKNDTGLPDKYLLSYLKSPFGRKEITRLAQGTVRQQLRFKDLQKIPIVTNQEIVNAVRTYIDHAEAYRSKALEEEAKIASKIADAWAE